MHTKKQEKNEGMVELLLFVCVRTREREREREKEKQAVALARSLFFLLLHSSISLSIPHNMCSVPREKEGKREREECSKWSRC